MSEEIEPEEWSEEEYKNLIGYESYEKESMLGDMLDMAGRIGGEWGWPSIIPTDLGLSEAQAILICQLGKVDKLQQYVRKKKHWKRWGDFIVQTVVMPVEWEKVWERMEISGLTMQEYGQLIDELVKEKRIARRRESGSADGVNFYETDILSPADSHP